MKIKNKFIVLLFSLILMFTYALNIFADENENTNGKANINVYYSDDVTPTAGDTFSLTIKTLDKTVQLEIDASTLVENGGNVELPVGDYEVVSIEYKGNNEIIKTQKYGVTNLFSIKNYADSNIYIGIGNEKSDWLNSTYTSVLLVNQQTQDDNLPYVRETENVDIPDDNENEITETNNENNNVTNENHVNGDETPSIIHYEYNKENKKDKSSPFLIKLIPMAFILIIGLIIIFIFHKRGKI